MTSTASCHRTAWGRYPSMSKIKTVLFIFCILSHTLFANTVPEPQPEYEVKAALLLNFIRYTEWPDQVFPNSKSPIEVCILGKDQFGNILEKTFSGKKVFERELKIRREKYQDKTLQSCHVIFMGKLDKSQEEEVIKSVQARPVLTVFDTNEPNALNGTISFIDSGETIEFEINLKAATQSGLKLSSRMIPLAKKVRR